MPRESFNFQEGNGEGNRLGMSCNVFILFCWAFSQSKAELSLEALELFSIWLQLQHVHIQFSKKEGRMVIGSEY